MNIIASPVLIDPSIFLALFNISDAENLHVTAGFGDVFIRKMFSTGGCRAVRGSIDVL